MNNKLSCNIVKDLLPAYIDNLTSRETNEAVENHLNTCQNCSAVFDRISSPDPIINEDDAEVDYLRKVRKRTGKVGVLCAVCALLICAIIIKIFVIGSSIVLSQLPLNNLDVYYSGGSVVFAGTLTDSGTKISRVTCTEEDGVMTIKAYSVPVLFGGSGTFSKTLYVKEPPDKIVFDGAVVWDSGLQISQLAVDLFNSKNDDVTDMAANEKIAEIIGISNVMDDYTIELYTDSAPYKLSITSDRVFYSQDAINIYMTRASCLLFTSIEDLDRVTWHVKYDKDINVTYSLSRGRASNELGLDFSALAQSPGSFQSLLETLEFDIEHPFRIGNKFIELHNVATPVIAPYD